MTQQQQQQQNKPKTCPSEIDWEGIASLEIVSAMSVTTDRATRRLAGTLRSAYEKGRIDERMAQRAGFSGDKFFSGDF
jgi:hypothetical protein